MTLQQLKYAIEIAKCGSINIAAKMLFITQPSLSNAIKALEIELNKTIFERTNRGISVTVDGAEFLGYARQVIEQTELLEKRYFNAKPSMQHFSVSTQHYAFAVNAFVELIKEYGIHKYEFNLKETKTYEIIDDVKNLRSEIGILYLNEFNSKVLNKLFEENSLKFTKLFVAKPHVFISVKNPLSKLKEITLKDLEDYPYLSFEQGEFNSFHFSEEILSTISHNKISELMIEQRFLIYPGVYDIHSPRIPSVDEIVTVITSMLEKINTQKLWINPDCGLKTRGVSETILSLKNLVDATKKVRDTL